VAAGVLCYVACLGIFGYIAATRMPNVPTWFLVAVRVVFGLVPVIVGITVYGLLIRYYHPNRQFLDGETRCRKCGYILRGISEPRCPECGERI